MMIVLQLLLFIVLISVAVLAVATLMTGIPSLPMRGQELAEVIKISAVQEGETVFDFGCGFGQVLGAFRSLGAKVHGWEINPVAWLVAASRLGVGSVTFGSFWQADPSKADIITVFLMPSVMGRVEKEIYSKMKRGARLVSNFFPLPNVEPTKVSGVVYLYEK